MAYTLSPFSDSNPAGHRLQGDHHDLVVGVVVGVVPRAARVVCMLDRCAPAVVVVVVVDAEGPPNSRSDKGSKVADFGLAHWAAGNLAAAVAVLDCTPVALPDTLAAMTDMAGG